MLASRVALVVGMLVDFFFVLDSHIAWRTLAASQAAGKAFLSWEFKLKFKKTSWSGCSWGTSSAKHRSSQNPTPLLKGQLTSAWTRSHGTSSEQRVQWELVTLWLSTLCWRSCVGRRLCSRQKMKLLSVESRPGRMLSAHTWSQLMLGFWVSVFVNDTNNDKKLG